MAFRIEVSYQAENDFANIMDYMSLTFDNPHVASIFQNELEKKIDLLFDNPFLYEEVTDKYFNKSGLRKIPIKNYIVIYCVNEKKNLIKIMRFFNQRQNYLEVL